MVSSYFAELARGSGSEFF